MSLLELVLACGERLDVHRFTVSEAVSSLFTIKVLARSPEPCLALQAIVGRPAALRVAHAGRLWSGICSHARLAHALDLGEGEAGLSSYELTLVPSLWLLTQRADHRIFQHLSIPDIAGRLLAGWGLQATWRIDAAEHPRLACRVQYGESDLDFLSRLLEEAGIAATFTDDDGEGSRLVLSDALHRSAPRREASLRHVDNASGRIPREHATRVAVEEDVRPDVVTLRDHDFRRPAWALLGQARAPGGGDAGVLERYAYQPGAFLVNGGAGAGSHDDRHGEALAARALEAARAGRLLVTFETGAVDLRPGTIVTLGGHPLPDLDPREGGLLVLSIALDGKPNGEWTLRAVATPAREPYRPPRRTPRPRVDGVQSAVVVGPPGQEIHTDEHGRVRVQFPWDREGRLDEHSSCWLRVAQGWAGAGFGWFALPRVGQEVLVAFLGGEPDQPIVVGRVGNALNPPPVKLPEEQTQSVWRSASSPGGEGFSEIRIEDRKGEELLALRAERDLGLAARGDRTEVVGGDATARVEGRLVEYVGADAHRSTAGEHRERIGGDQSLTVDGDQHQRVGGAAALEAGGAIHLRAAGRVVIEGSDVTLRAPGGFVRIDAGGVTIDGAVVNLQSGGAPGEGPGAAPAPPLVPQRADQRSPGPRRLPLIGFPGLPPLQAPGAPGGGPPPRTPGQIAVCGLICQCKDDPSPHVRPSDCVTARIRAQEDASGQTSKLKAEVPYDMSKKPPAPIMSRNDPRRATRRKPKDSQVPDVIVVNDGNKPPTQDNIEEVIEIKFPPDKLTEEQKKQYRRIAGDAPLEVFTPERCGCPGPRKKPKPVANEEIVAAAALTLLLLALLMARQGPAASRVLSKLAPLIQRLLPLFSP